MRARRAGGGLFSFLAEFHVAGLWREEVLMVPTVSLPICSERGRWRCHAERQSATCVECCEELMIGRGEQREGGDREGRWKRWKRALRALRM